MRSVTAVFLALLFSATLKAQNPEGTSNAESNNTVVQVPADSAGANSDGSTLNPPGPAPQAHPAAITYSDAYETRLKIHKYASYVTLPLFAAEVGLGESLYNNPNEKGAVAAFHGVVGAGIVGLFGVNTVTGAWNLFGEARHDPNGRTVKLVHGILMMVADAGFAATVALAPRQNRSSTANGQTSVVDVQLNRAAHRDVAFASVGVGTFSYLIMLFGKH